MSRNFVNHLKKINEAQGPGTGLGYYDLLYRYVLNYSCNRYTFFQQGARSRYRRMRKLLYTVTTGRYDSLNEVANPLPNWDYICYTDDPNLQSATWQVELLENELDLDPVLAAAHMVVPGSDGVQLRTFQMSGNRSPLHSLLAFKTLFYKMDHR